MTRFVLAGALLSLVVGEMACRRRPLPAATGDARDAGFPSTADGAPDADASDALGTCPPGLDLSFAQQGRGEIDSDISIIESVLVQPDGKVVALGESSRALQGDALPAFGAVRLGADGRPDPSFGRNGTSTVQLPPRGGQLRGGALQSDGKVIVVGSAYSDDGIWLVARFDQGGSLDPSFGSSGFAPVSIADAAPSSVALAADGSILVAGTVRVPLDGYCCDGNVVVAKYDPGGNLDPKFGAGGLVVTPVGVASGDDYASAIVVQPDGHIVVAGNAYVATDGGGPPQEEGMLLRFTSAGALDAAFGSNGIVLIDRYRRANTLALQGDGKLLVSVSAGADANELVVARYTTAGVSDVTFGSGGATQIALPPVDGGPRGGVASGLFSLRDGSIVVAGPADGEGFFLVKVGTDGARDAAFGRNDGILETQLAAGAAAVGPDGKAVVAGSRLGDDPGGLAVIERYCP
jgi:uncharacterized delta-60 repeat protein